MNNDRTPHPDWTFGPVSGPLVGSLAAAAVAIAGPTAHYPIWLPAGIGVVGATGVVLTHLRTKPLGLMTYRALSWLGPGVWATWMDAQGGVTWLGGYALAAGAIIAGLTAPLVAATPDGLHGTPTADRKSPAHMARALKAAIDGLLGLREPGVDVLDIRPWPTGAGYDAIIEFPAETGYGEDELQGIIVKLARRLRLPPGCSPSAEEYEVQGRVILRVPTVDDLATVTNYPRDYSRRSILDPLTIGHYGDRTPTTINLRESSMVIGGRKGGGKTNGADVVGGNLARCDDALIWDVDLNGGGISVPWLVAWIDNDLEAPVIDWPAWNPEEAYALSVVALDIVKDRKARYGVDAVRADSRLIPITPACPEIVIRIDEAAEVLGETSPYPKMRENFTEIVRLGRSVGVNVVTCSLRVTGDHIPVQVRKNCAIRVTTKVEEDNELDYIFNYERGLRSNSLRTKGEAFIYQGDDEGSGGSVRKFKFFNLLPSGIAEIAQATAGWRPKLDPAGQEVGGPVYAQRWNRARPFLAKLGFTLPTPLQAAVMLASGVVDDATQATLTSNVGHAITGLPKEPETTADALTAYEKAKRKADDERLQKAVEDPEHVRATFDELVKDLRTQPAGSTLKDRVALVAKFVRDAGEAGIFRRKVIALVKEQGIEVSDQTVSEWLATAETEGLIRRGAKQGLWIPNNEQESE